MWAWRGPSTAPHRNSARPAVEHAADYRPAIGGSYLLPRASGTHCRRMSESVRLQLPHVAVHGTTFVPRGVGQYHYSGCGCSVRPWEGDAVDWIWTAGAKKAPRTRHLRIGYLIPHHNVTGGMKMIMCVFLALGPRGGAGTGPGPSRGVRKSRLSHVTPMGPSLHRGAHPRANAAPGACSPPDRCVPPASSSATCAPAATGSRRCTAASRALPCSRRGPTSRWTRRSWSQPPSPGAPPSRAATWPWSGAWRVPPVAEASR